MSIGVTGPCVGGIGLSVGTPVNNTNVILDDKHYTYTILYLRSQISSFILLTIELLNASDIILRKSEVFGEGVRGSH